MAITKEKLQMLINAGEITGIGISPGITFSLDVSTGMVMATKTEGYAGPDFSINPETGQMEVTA